MKTLHTLSIMLDELTITVHVQLTNIFCNADTITPTLPWTCRLCSISEFKVPSCQTTKVLTSCSVGRGVGICLFAAVERSYSSYDAHFYISGNGSVVDGLVGLKRSPVHNSGHTILSFSGHQNCIIAPTKALIWTHTTLPITLRTFTCRKQGTSQYELGYNHRERNSNVISSQMS
jgi:hypothetical protein